MYEFDARKTKDEIIQWIRDWFKENGPDCNAVVAISGGKDSSVTATLCVEALGSSRVFGVLLPNGVQHDMDMSLMLVEHLGIPHAIINIEEPFTSIMAALSENLPVPTSAQTRINLPPRLRMAITYAVSQSMNGRVANTSNLSEDWVGYATRYGDMAGDFSPLSKLTVQEVKAIGHELRIPKELVEKIPIDGLTDLTDEDNLGFTYAVLAKYIRTGVCEDPEAKRLIDTKRRTSKFKLEPLPCFPFDGPIRADD